MASPTVTGAIIAIVVYFALLSMFTSGFIASMSATEKANLDIPNMRIPDFIGGYRSPANESYDLTQLNTSDISSINFASITIDRGSFARNTTYGWESTDDGVNRALFTTTEDIYNERKNNYTVYNPSHKEWKMFLSIQKSPFDLYMDTIEVQVKSDGYYLYSATAGVYYVEVCHVPASPLTDTDVVQTYFKNTHEGGVMTDYVGVHTTSGSCMGQTDSLLSSLWYGGWEVYGDNFFMTSLSSNVQNFPDPTPSTEVGGVASVLGTVVQAIGYVVFIFGMVLMPWGIGSGDIGLAFVDGVFFKLPLFALFILGIAWLKPIGAS